METAMKAFSDTTFFAMLRSRGWKHWLTVCALITVGLLIGDAMQNSEPTLHWQYKLYQFLNRRARAASHSDDISLVLIGDDEYWKGDLARRSPLKRTYLAKLLKHIDASDPAVIAFDIDMRAQTTDGSLIEHADYHGETGELLNAISTLTCRKCIVVLPRAIHFDRASGRYVELADAFDRLAKPKVVRGY